MKQMVPRAREDSLLIKPLEDEVLVCDVDAGKCYCLNRTVALVWHNCDGRKTFSEITRLLMKELKAPIDDNVVWLALGQLEKFDLLQQRLARPASIPILSRRQMVRSLGVAAAVALPLITSIVAPSAQPAGSAISEATCDARPKGSCLNTPCTAGGQCASPGNSPAIALVESC